MKKRMTVFFVLFISLFLAVGAMGCGGEDPDARLEKYVVFRDDTGHFRDVTIDYLYGGVYSCEVEYDANKSYGFSMASYYEKSDSAGGDSYSDNRRVSEPGTYRFTLNVYLGTETKYKDYTLELIIKMPKIDFDPAGTIDYIDGEYYKYVYSGENQFPKPICGEIARHSSYFFIDSFSDEAKKIRTYPKEVGIYYFEYDVRYDNEETGKFLSTKVYITIEIVESNEAIT